VDALPGGDRVVRFAQHIGGVPVLAGDLVVTVNGAGQVVSATAETPVGPPTATAASVSGATAGQTGRAGGGEKLGGPPAGLPGARAPRWVDEPRLLGAPGRGQLRPTWMVRLRLDGLTAPSATALVDATDGSVSLVFSEVKFARNRLICDLNSAAVDLNNPATYRCDTAAGGPPVRRTEGGAAASVADVNKAYDLLGDTYTFYRREVGRDSIDGRGLPMRATVRACYRPGPPFPDECPFENAFWDGAQMVFGSGFADADDVVGHELTHGVTDFTSQLFYAFQSGAINEAFSDIMGEFMDQTNGRGTDTPATKWQIGEDLPATVGVIRDMQDPTAPLPSPGEPPPPPCDDPDNDEFRRGCQPDRVGSPLYEHDPGYLDNGGVHINSGIANKAAFLLGEPGSHSFNGASITALGPTKSIQLWYRAILGMTSGGDYEDLGNVLQVSCRRLVGHFRFTLADCAQVDAVVAATEMMTVQTSGTEEAGMCDTPGQPIQDAFFDGFESGAGNWTLSRAAVAPNSGYPFRWAHSGVNALRLFTNSTGAASMVMKNFVTVPANGYLWFAHLPFVGQQRLRLFNGTTTTEIPFESGWTALPRTGWGPPTIANGYVSTRFNLSAFAGQSLKVTFVEDLPGEWFVDDVHIYQCVNRVGPVRNLAGPRNEFRTSASLSWDAPLFSGPGVAGYEIDVFPAVTGYPQTVSGTTHTMTGLNPNRRYDVTVRAVGTANGAGGPTTLRLDLLPSCSALDPPENSLWTCTASAPQKPRPGG
jgi:Zn-dependent metalloprotease